MHHPTISAITRDAWKIIDRYDLRHESHMLQVKMELSDCQDHSHRDEALITITYKRPNAEKPTAEIRDHFHPCLALIEFERMISTAAASNITQLITR